MRRASVSLIIILQSHLVTTPLFSLSLDAFTMKVLNLRTTLPRTILSRNYMVRIVSSLYAFVLHFKYHRYTVPTTQTHTLLSGNKYVHVPGSYRICMYNICCRVYSLLCILTIKFTPRKKSYHGILCVICVYHIVSSL